MGLKIGICKIARKLIFNLIHSLHEREFIRLVIARLHLKGIEINGSPIDANRCARLEFGHLEAVILEPIGKTASRPLPYPATLK